MKRLCLSVLVLVLLAGVVPSQSVLAGLQDGLVAHWPFSGNANDESGNGHNGVVHSATSSQDRFGSPQNAYNFSQSVAYDQTLGGQFIQVGEIAELSGLQQFTGAVWIKPSYPPEEGWGGGIVAAISEWGGTYNGFSVNTGSQGDFYVQLSGTSISKRLWAYLPPGIISQNTWQFVAWVFDGTQTDVTKKIKIYHNAIEQSVTFPLTYPLTTLNAGNKPLRIAVSGITDAGNYWYYQGAIDDIRLYDRALSDVEIRELYGMGGGIQGCLKIEGFPAANRQVTLTQNLIPNKTVFTDRQGCYSFSDALTDRPFSVMVQSTWAPVSSPVGFVAKSATKDKVNLSWKYAPTDVTSFNIYRLKGVSGSWTLLATTAPDDRAYSDATALSNDLTNAYAYYIEGCNNDGWSPATQTAIIPFKATALKATPSAGKIELAWADNGASETGFTVYRKDGECSSTSVWKPLQDVAANTTNLDDTTGTVGQTYSYRVRAYFKSAAEPFALGYTLYSNCNSGKAE